MRRRDCGLQARGGENDQVQSVGTGAAFGRGVASIAEQVLALVDTEPFALPEARLDPITGILNQLRGTPELADAIAARTRAVAADPFGDPVPFARLLAGEDGSDAG